MKIKNRKLTLDEFNNYSKKYGFIIPHSEIYGGLSSTYDFGPLGMFIKKEIKNTWWNFFVTKNELIHGMDSGIITNEKVLSASGHLKTFQGQYISRCENCHKTKEFSNEEIENLKSLKNIELFCNCKTIICIKCKKENILNKNETFCKFNNKNQIIESFIKCFNCANEIKWYIFKSFNLLFKSEKGNSFDKQQFVYLRPETAQGIFINATQISRSLKLKIPFGLAQIGKSFRNEITTEKSIFRTTEFEQMEIEFFCEDIKPKDTMYWFEKYVKEINYFLEYKLNLNKNNFREKRQTTGIAHYSKVTSDFEYKFPFGWQEIIGLAHRGQYDLTNHKNHSKKSIELYNSNGKRVIPNVIEPSFGVERLMLAMLFEKLILEKNLDKERLVLNLDSKFCYYNVAILPLTEKLNVKAKEIFQILKKDTNLRIVLHTKKSVGKRYLYHDAIGTKYCITIDFETEKDNCITIRDRETTNQSRIEIKNIIKNLIV